jgi:hypothetical protein
LDDRGTEPKSWLVVSNIFVAHDWASTAEPTRRVPKTAQHDLRTMTSPPVVMHRSAQEREEAVEDKRSIAAWQPPATAKPGG